MVTARLGTSLLLGSIALLTSPLGHTDIITSGEVFRDASNTLVVGTDVGPGSYLLNQGSLDVARSLAVATAPIALPSDATVTGTGSTLLLNGIGQSNHLDLLAGTGSVTVIDGGTIAVTADRTQCAAGWCNNFVGNFAGSDATLTVSGSGSSATGFFNAFVVGATGVFTQEESGFDGGIIGGSTTAEVNVLDGGFLQTEGVSIAQTLSADGDGTESSTASVNIDGIGSSWVGTSAGIGTGENAFGSLNITNGGVGIIQSTSEVAAASYFVGFNGGSGQINIDGEGSQLIVDSDSGAFSIIENGAVNVLDGGSLIHQGNSNLAVGFNNSLGRLTIGEGATVEVAQTIVGIDNQTGGSGIVSLNQGTLIGDLFIDDNGLLLGSGTVQGNVVDRGGIIGPGFSPGVIEITGDLTSDGGTLEIEIGGSELGLYDQIVVGGTADLANFDVVFSFIDDFTPTTGDIFDFLVADLISQPFDTNRFSFEGLSRGFEFDFLFADSSFSLVTTQSAAVPEPGTLGLLGAGLLGLGYYRRRRAWR